MNTLNNSFVAIAAVLLVACSGDSFEETNSPGVTEFDAGQDSKEDADNQDSDANSVETGVDSNTTDTAEQDTKEDNNTTDSNEASVDCAHGDKQCDGLKSMFCSEGAWVLLAECPFACVDGDCFGECNNGEVRCNGNDKEVCEDNRYKVDTVCDFACNNNECVVCGNGVVETPEVCDDGNPFYCDGCEVCQSKRFITFSTNGVGDVIFNDNPAKDLSLLNANYTIEMWVMFTFSNGSITLERSGGWTFELIDSNLLNVCVNTECFQWGVDLAINKWYHLAWFYNGSLSTIYFNGIKSVAKQHTKTLPWTDNNVILSGQSVSVGEIRISDGAKYMTAFTPERTFSSVGTIAHWKFDEPFAPFVDSSGKGQTGNNGSSIFGYTSNPDDCYKGMFIP